MAEEEVTASTEATDEVTGAAVTGEQVATEDQGQDSATKLKEYEEKLAQLTSDLAREQEQRTAAEQSAKEAEAARIQAFREKTTEENIRKGIQRETTAKLQELARLQSQMADQNISEAKLEKMERLVSRLAESQLEPDEVKKINEDIESERLRKENERLRQQFNAPQARTPEPPPLTDAYKQDLKEAYFSEFEDVDPRELTEADWARDATSTEDWYARTRQAYVRIQNSKKASVVSEPVTASNALPDAFQQQLNTFREEEAKRLEEANAKIKQLEDAQQQKVQELEERIARLSGVDREGAPPVATATQRSAAASLPPDEWLYGTPEQKKAYRTAMDDKGLRDRILGRA